MASQDEKIYPWCVLGTVTIYMVLEPGYQK